MLPELENYHSTNYSNCNLTYNYLATWQGLAYPSHIIQVIAAPIQIFTFYIILKKTPKTMNTMKCPLLVNHFCATWLDLVFCTPSTPYIFVPTISLFGVGILSYWELPFSPQIAVVGVSVMMYYLFVAPPSRSLSFETRRAQRRFFIGIMIHTLIPLLVLGIPPLVLIVSVLTDNYRQEYTNLCMTLLGFNGLIESLAILLVHRPYRFAVKEIFCFRKLKYPKVYVIPVCESSSSRRVNPQI